MEIGMELKSKKQWKLFLVLKKMAKVLLYTYTNGLLTKCEVNIAQVLFFSEFMDRDEVEFHKLAEKE